MKKTFFFIPAILLTAYYGGLAVGAGAAAVQPVMWIGLLLLWRRNPAVAAVYLGRVLRGAAGAAPDLPEHAGGGAAGTG